MSNITDTDKDITDFLEGEDWIKESSGDVPIHEFVEYEPLQGVLVEKRENVGANNSMMYVLEKKDGQRVSFWGSSIIDQRMSNKQPGQELAIMYKGEAKSEKTGRKYKDYEFAFKKYEGGDIPF